ncbi:acriflavin resistance protein, putative [Babesia ovis]|uniref:Acriflavin resistance protein, putative n=1 Tax=Babesia ovis TaxID=5869 RepID=A0A9W5TBW0_BABOV|nr:acriflavin resistance protein, putative [Babesia ovis]
MQTLKVVLAAICLVAQQATAYSMGTLQSNVTTVTNGGLTPSGVKDLQTSSSTGTPHASNHVVQNNTFTSIGDWFGGSSTSSQKANEVIQIGPQNVMNVHRKKVVPNPYIEVQKSVPAYEDDQERSMIHFTVHTNPNETINVKNAKLQLQVISGAEDFGLDCPSKNVNIQRIYHPDPNGAEEPQKVGPVIKAEIKDGKLSCDLSTAFGEGANAVDYKDFWLLLETDPMCYYSFDVNPAVSNVTMEVDKSVRGEGPSVNRAMISTLTVIAVVVLGGAAYFYNSSRTDYTYFQDQGDFVVNA